MKELLIKNNKMWLGTVHFAGIYEDNFSSDDVKNTINYCMELGLDKIDTAECYGIDALIEKYLGEALHGNREKFTVSTKFGHIHKSTGVKKNDFSLNGVKKQLENSLKNLKSDYLDIYYFHSGTNKEFDNDDLWGYLNTMKDRGVINELGLSLNHQNVIDGDHYQLGSARKFGITVVQTLFNLYSRVALNHVIPFCKNNHIKIIGRSPIAKGLLSGKYNASSKFSISDERSKFKRENESILSDYNNSTIEKALLFSKSKVDEIIVGAKSFEQILQNFSIINL